MPRTLYLHKSEWQRITEQINKNVESVKSFKTDLDYEEYLKNGSREMTKNWENTVEKNRQRKDDERKRLEDQKKAEVEHCFRELKKHDEEDRRARIAYAESLLKRLKAGPQQLESAYMLSKILHEQQKQREEKRRQQETERLMRLFEGRKLIEQAARWIDDQKEQMRKYYGRCAEYKKILQLDIDEKERSKRELTRKLLELEKHECEANTKQMQEVIEKEQKLLLEQRRDRQKADSVAKSNVYQKLQRDAIKINMEQKRIDEYVAKKSQEEIRRKYQLKLKQKQKIEHCNELAEKLFKSLPDVEFAENECYQRAINDFAQSWNEQEKKKLEHLQRLKKDRIETHVKEMEVIEKLKQQAALEGKMDVLNRKFNEQVDVVFDKQQRSTRVKRIEKLKKLIREQADQRERDERKEMEQNRIETNRAIDSEAQKDNEDFLDHAAKLVHDAKAKGLPTYPLMKAIKEYIVQHSLLPQSDDLPHLKSHIDIGISIERKKSESKQTNKIELTMRK